jgi:Putative prokaryotic signal transducing protein
VWTCPKCATDVEDSFEVCWQCGTALDGTEDPAFEPERDGVMSGEDFEADRAARVQGRLVTVGTFLDSTEAHLLCSRLEAAGIRAMVLDERGTALYGGFLGVDSGAKVVVHEADLGLALEQAQQILGEDRSRPAKEAPRGKDSESIRRPPESMRDGGGGLLPDGL